MSKPCVRVSSLDHCLAVVKIGSLISLECPDVIVLAELCGFKCLYTSNLPALPPMKYFESGMVDHAFIIPVLRIQSQPRAQRVRSASSTKQDPGWPGKLRRGSLSSERKKKGKRKILNLYPFVDCTISYTLFDQDLPCYTKQEYLLLIHNYIP